MGTEQNTQEKLERLKRYFSELGKVAIAYSSGVDSTFMLKAAHDVLRENAIAVTAKADVFPKRELEEAEAFCRAEGIRHFVVPVVPLEVEGFAENPPERCYICKKAIFDKIVDIANTQGIHCVAEGSNVDDLKDYRPGMKAVHEMGILSPLREVELTKAEIRILSKDLGLATWEKPSLACLASRFAYGETITEEKLLMVEKAEQFLLDMGFHQMRVRMHGQMARIEVAVEEFSFLMEEENRVKILETLRKIGFIYVTMDLAGYRTGSMNETLSKISL
ncbi:MAG: ATP-dependent sacrificial sulfur transferase LarE [Lachnospiraceae bacterium]|nr:ATP-dependent sacrificial sulfur transferase LarE [Lachnospiraceae bacterium]